MPPAEKVAIRQGSLVAVLVAVAFRMWRYLVRHNAMIILAVCAVSIDVMRNYATRCNILQNGEILTTNQ